MTSASPFAAMANAQLTFQVATDSLIIDNNGNLTPQTTAITLTALLKPNKVGTPTINIEPGQDEIMEEMEGFLVDPLDFPDRINPMSLATCQIQVSTSRVLKGKFRLLPYTQNPFVIAANVTGLVRLRGIVIYRQSQVY